MLTVLIIFFAISGLLLFAGHRKTAIGVGIVGLCIISIPLLWIGSASLLNSQPEFVEHSPHEKWLPESARDISYLKSYSYTAYEFTIEEAEFKKYALENEWDLKEINEEKRIARYLRFAEFVGRSSNSSDSYATVKRGLWYEVRLRNGGGISVAYDRDSQRAYIQKSPR